MFKQGGKNINPRIYLNMQKWWSSSGQNIFGGIQKYHVFSADFGKFDKVGMSCCFGSVWPQGTARVI